MPNHDNGYFERHHCHLSSQTQDKRIKDWKAVGAILGFTQEELDMIDGGYKNDDQKKTTLLIQWSMRHGKEAT